MKRNSVNNVLYLFGAHLIKIRKDAGFSQKDFDYETELEISQICRIEKGKTDACLSTLYTLAVALKITVAELLAF